MRESSCQGNETPCLVPSTPRATVFVKTLGNAMAATEDEAASRRAVYVLLSKSCSMTKFSALFPLILIEDQHPVDMSYKLN